MSLDFNKWMELALKEARKGWGKTHPNPTVGAVIVHQGELASRGYTEPAGGRHAEICALDAFAGVTPDDSTYLFVTLEPCSTHGRTPPCTDAIIESGIKHIVIGAIDPNPNHSGRGIDVLKQAGLTVHEGILKDSCTDLNLIFNHWITRGKPFLAGKIATTLDGRIATRGGLSKWITNTESRQDVMRWRRYFPAIAVGAGTALTDNPKLTSRVEGEEEWCPIRFVFDRNLITLKDDELPRLYQDEYANRTIIISVPERSNKLEKRAHDLGLDYWILEQKNGDGGLNHFAEKCAKSNISGVFIEGGSQLLSSFLNHELLNYLLAYRAPKLLADVAGLSPFVGQEPIAMNKTIQLKQVKHHTFGEDALMRGFLEYP